jgi:hypothetical protein
VSQAEIRSSFSHRWNVASIDTARYEAKFDHQSAPAWLATIERTKSCGNADA